MANNRTFRYNLQFTADASKAERELLNLQRTLDTIQRSSLNLNSFEMTADLKEATRAAAELSAQLTLATNVNTGKLDLGKLSDSLKASNKDLNYYAATLSKLGPVGEQAFTQFTNSILLAEMPLKRTSAWVDKLWKSLKNTVTWQISSSAIHSIMGAVQGAYGYAQDLNRALNDIQIVSEKSADDMARFAKEANRAAKELKTTTTAYADAALIFYQQGGMTEQEIAERTAVTVKMANVARTSAEEASNQLTAVWNNFYDGSKSLEYYADVMTALGAATASSTEEISDGLQKFASIGNTIGLSYEYATAALATVTATTRESADTVGNAFKTLFARVQGLNLGETLDDGTTLNKYSSALAKVGIDIFNQHDELKGMDVILDELGGKWQTLSRDTQMALAQTVGGVRQYQQLITLMDNWDTFNKNLDIANNATGALNKQSEIYAESWEAASKEVKASIEGLYDSILKDEFFIELTKNIATAISGVELFIDSMGGVEQLLITIGGLITTIFQKQIISTLKDAGYSIKNASISLYNSVVKEDKKIKTPERQMKEDAINALQTGLGPNVSQDRKDIYSTYASAQMDYIQNAEKMNELDQERLKIQLDILATQRDSALKQEEQVRLAEIENRSSRLSFEHAVDRANSRRPQSQRLNAQANDVKGMAKHVRASAAARSAFDAMVADIPDGQAYDKDLLNKQLKARLAKMTGAQDFKNVDAAKLVQVLGLSDDYRANSQNLGMGGVSQDTIDNVNAVIDALNSNEDSVKLFEAFSNLQGELSSSAPLLDKFRAALSAFNGQGVDFNTIVDEMIANSETLGEETDDLVKNTENLNVSHQNLAKGYQANKNAQIDWTTMITAGVGAVMSLSGAVSTLSSLVGILNDENATTEEKLAATGSLITTLIPTIISLSQAYNTMSTTAAAAGATVQASLGWISLIIAAVVALGTLLIPLIDFRTEEEKAAAALEEMSAAAEEAAAKVEELKAAFEGYDAVVDSLEDCVRGTKEWDEALKAVNEEVLEILKNNPELAKVEGLFVRDLDTGMLVLDEKKREEVTKQAEFSAKVMDNAATIQRYGNELQKAQDRRSGLGGILYGDIRTKNNVGVTNTITAYDIDLASIFSEYGNELATMTEDEFKTAIRERLEQQLSSTLSTKREEAYSEQVLSAELDALTESSLKYREELQKRIKEEQDATKALSTVAQALVDSELGDKYSGATKQIVTDAVYSAELERIRKQVEEAGKGDWQSDTSTDNSQAIWDRYVKASGRSTIIAHSNQIRGTAGNREYAYYDEEGKLQTIGLKSMAAVIATAEALEGLGLKADEVAKRFEELEKQVGSQITTGIEGLITTGTFEGMSRDDIDRLTTIARKKTGNKNLSEADAILQAMVEVMGSEEAVFEYLGADNKVSALQVIGEKWWTANQINRKDIISGAVVSSVQDELQAINPLTTLSNDELRQFENLLNQVYGTSGSAGIGVLKQIIGRGEEPDSVISALGSITDWATVDVEQLRDSLQEAGVSTYYTDEELQNLIEHMQNAADITFEELSAKYAAIHKIIDDITVGTAISAEEMRQLDDYITQDISSYFMRMADGTYKLTHDAKEFYDLVNGEVSKTLDDKAEGAKSDHTRLINLEKNFSKGNNADKLIDNQGNRYNIQGQIEALLGAGAIGNSVEEQALLKSWREGKDLDKLQEKITETFKSPEEALAALQRRLSIVAEESNNAQQAAAMSRKSFEELQQGFDQEIYGAEQFAQAYQYLEEVIAKEGLDASSIETYSDYLQEAKGYTEELAKATAISVVRIKSGLDSLTNGGYEWLAVLNDNAASEWARADALKNLKSIFADAFDVSEEIFTEDFFKLINAREGVQALLSGDASGYTTIQKAIADELLNSYGLIDDSMWVGDIIDGAMSASGYLTAMSSKLSRDQLEKLADVMGYELFYDKNNVLSDIRQKSLEDIQQAIEEAIAGGKSLEDILTPLDEVIERYKEINDQLDIQADNLSDIEQEIDQLYGANRIPELIKYNQVLEATNANLSLKRGEAEGYLTTDGTAVTALGFKIDEDGTISNYRTIMEALYTDLNDAESRGDIAAAENIKRKIEKAQAAIDKYDATRKELQDIDNEIVKNNANMLSKNYELLTTYYDKTIELSELDVATLDYLDSKYADSFEGMSDIAGNSAQRLENSKVNLTALSEEAKALATAYSNGKISQAEYVEGLKKVQDGIYGELTAINELDDKMKNYYSDTLAKGNEEMDKYIGYIDALRTSLDHLSNLMSLVGRNKDFEALGNILSTSGEVARLSFETNKSIYEASAEELNRLQTLDISGYTTSALEQYREELEAAEQDSREKYNEMIASAQAWGEALKAIADNQLAEFADALEGSLTGGRSFADISLGMERRNSLQEEYLTTTNKLYETNKLMRTAEEALEQTTNALSKKKLQAFMDETKHLQNQTKLSKYELELQQAKYDVLVAELALEEAQNAASVVRLTRDAEGNFGYVYTADQDAIDGAIQNLEDANNNLYNKSLEGINKYTEQYYSFQEEFFNKSLELQQQWKNGEIETEREYEEKKLALAQYYSQKLQDVYSLLNVSRGADERAAQDTWLQEDIKAIQSIDKVLASVNTYNTSSANAIDNLKQGLSEIDSILSDKNLTEQLGDIGDSADNYLNIITKDGGLLDALANELDAVSKITAQYKEQKTALEGIIASHETLASINNGKLDEIISTIIAGGTLTSEDKEYLKSIGVKFDTGGYTGAWGSGGRMAMLHEKELVLNKTDTANFLAGIEVLRSIVSVIDMHALNAQLGGAIAAPRLANALGEGVVQHVKIEASFPNAINHSEIEEAFYNLANEASQYINKK